MVNLLLAQLALRLGSVDFKLALCYMTLPSTECECKLAIATIIGGAEFHFKKRINMGRGDERIRGME